MKREFTPSSDIRRAERWCAVYELALSTSALPFLADHRVGTSVIVPAAALIEIALAAARDAISPEVHSLCNLSFDTPVVLMGTQEANLRVCFSEADALGSGFLIEEALETGQQRIATGRALIGRHAIESSIPFIAAGAVESLDGSLVYRALKRRGLHYGPSFHAVERVQRALTVATADLRLPVPIEDEAHRFLIHPVMLDAALQVAGALIESRDASGQCWLPAELEQFCWYQSPGMRGHSSIRLMATASDRVEVDVELRDQDGQLCATIRSLRLRPAGRMGASHEVENVSLAAELPAEQPDIAQDGPSDLGGIRPASFRKQFGVAVRQVLELGDHDFSPNRSLLQLGLDSLTALELHNRLYTGFGIEISPTELLRSTSIDALIEHLSGKTARSPASFRTRSHSSSVSELSLGQSALYLIHELSLDNSAYNVGEALRLQGRLDVSALRTSVQRLAQRHPMLRARFFWQGEDICQRFDEAAPELQVFDAESWGEEQLRQRLLADITARFDLNAAPPLRMTLYRRSDDQHILTIVIHHIAEDFWSLVILMRELMAAYEAACSNRDAGLPAMHADYGDFIRWQRQMLAGPEATALRTYWRGKLTKPLPTLELPFARRRPQEKTFGGATLHFRIGASLARRVHEMARENNVTLYSLTCAAFATLLYRYSGQTDLIVGSPFAGRPHPDLDHVVGYFDNVLPLRFELNGNPKFAELLARVHRIVLEAQDHQHLPFPAIVEEAQPLRDPGRSPLFDHVFVLRKAQTPALQELTAFTLGDTGSALQMGEVRIENCGVLLSHSQSQFDLTLALAEVGGILMGSIEYSTALFHEETVRRLAGHYQAILESIVENPASPLDELTVLTPSERHEALVDWNATEWSDSPQVGLHMLFERRVDEDPRRIALICGSEQLSYGDVERLANGLAHRLLSSGVVRADTVAVLLRRGWEQVVAVLGVLKAGATYLPLDVSWPEARATDVLSRSGAKVVVTSSDQSDSWLSSVRRLLVVEPTESAISRPWLEEFQPTAAAYVMFTSGSTGTPKGVVTDHLGPVNTIADLNERFTLSASDRVLALARLTFDLSVYDIFGVLGAGGAVVIPQPDEESDPAEWARLALCHGVTVWNSVPTLFQLYLQHLEDSPQLRPHTLRLVLLSGDWIPVTLPRRARELFAEAQVISLGGATEASIWSILYPIVEVDPEWSSIPYGRPLRNQKIFVLDRNGDPCPRGMTGEIHIGGRGVASGYLGAPELNARAFFDRPLLGRVYRTGDLGRYRSDGVVEILGRRDAQVKIRGNRVELEEIEAFLLRQAGVREATVATFERTPGQRSLVAYVVSGSQRPTQQSLRSAVSLALPDYMIPTAFVFLAAMPLTANGKVDRAALPLPDIAGESDVSWIAESASPAATLAQLWARYLRVDAVESSDDFFALGGDSVTAIQIAADARRAGIRLSPADILRCSTLEAVVAHARLGEFPPSGSDAPSVPVHSDGEPHGAIDHANSGDSLAAKFPLSGLSVQELERVISRLQEE